MALEIEDVIGRDPRLKNQKLQQVLNEINEKIGWQRVKDSINELVDLCGKNYQQELLGKPPFEIFLNRMFLGNPGEVFARHFRSRIHWYHTRSIKFFFLNKMWP